MDLLRMLNIIPRIFNRLFSCVPILGGTQLLALPIFAASCLPYLQIRVPLDSERVDDQVQAAEKSRS